MTRHCNARRSRLTLPAANGYDRRPLPHSDTVAVSYLARDRPGGPPARASSGAAARQRHGPASGAGHDADVPHLSAARRTRDGTRSWLRGAMLALAVLAGAAAVVSWDAQYVLVRSVKHNPAVAALEAGIPDIGAVIFAALGIALALHARRAIRARLLNVACVGISLAMNALASGRGWRDVAIWVMPSAVYALASDTLIGVVRAWVIARTRLTGQPLADDEPTPMAVVGRSALWLFRLAMAPASTMAGFRRWVLQQCPVPPPRATTPIRIATRPTPESTQPRGRSPAATRRQPGPSKQARLLALAGQRHDLTAIPLTSVSKLATGIAAEIDLAPGTARRILLAHVRSLRDDKDTRQEARS